MVSVYKHINELHKLLIDEENIDFFIDVSEKYKRSNKDLYKEVFDEMLEFSEKNNLKKAKAWANYYLGWYYFDMSDYFKAADIFLFSYDIFENEEYKKGVIYACNGLNIAYQQLGQFKLSNEWGLKGISLAEELNETNALVILLLNAGINYIKLNDFKKAREFYKTIDLLGCELNEYQNIAYYNALAEIEINDGDAEKALEILDVSVQIENMAGLDNDFSEIYRLKGMAYVKLELYEKAEKAFLNSLYISEKTEDLYEKCCTMIEQSKLLIKLDQFETAKQLLQKSVEICSKNKLNLLLRQLLNILYTVHKKCENYKEALGYLEEYMKLEEQMFDYEQNQLMAKLNIKRSDRQADLYKLLYDKTELLSSIGQKIISNLNFNSIIENINQELNKLINADSFGITLYDSKSGKLQCNYISKILKKINSVSLKLDDNNSYSAYCIKNKADMVIGNAKIEYKKYMQDSVSEDEMNQQEKSMIFTPLIIRDKVIGAMSVKSFKENAYDKNDLNTLKIIANYSAIAVDNAILFKKIENKATYDQMTGFLKRSEIVKFGQTIFNKHKAHNTKFSVIMMDIDNFKSINDNYGHHAGDEAITLIAKSIVNCIRSTDNIGRYGGDEFLLICPGANKSEAVEVAERIRRTVSNKKYTLGNDNITVKITLSIGVYEFRGTDNSFTDGIKAADKFMYQAKLNFKNKVEF